jgi:protease-4
VNSPGGSALASDVMERELEILKKKKTLIVSMGDVAASGGYMIAAPGERIFAEPNTITGSIGVFATVPHTGNFFKNKLGITFDRISTAPNSDIGNLNHPLTDAQRAWFQNSVNQTYDDFVGMVAKHRKIPLKKAYEIAEGRVYSGIEAKKIGLIDEGFAAFLEELSASAKMAWMGPEAWMVERVQTLFRTPVQTRLPVDITIE